ncbi:hypothetical protein GCM10023212_19630 [Luteolibacter yonseiensis]
MLEIGRRRVGPLATDTLATAFPHDNPLLKVLCRKMADFPGGSGAWKADKPEFFFSSRGGFRAPEAEPVR